MKSIALISPPAFGLKDKLAYPPLGLLYLASNMGGEYRLKIFNMLSLEDRIEGGFDIYGISIHSSSSYGPAKRISGIIRQENPSSLIVAGGAFPTSMAAYTLENTDVDVVVIGEGEVVFSHIAGGRALEEMNGIVYKKDGRIIVNEPEPLIADLDSIKFPARHLLPKEMIRHEGRVHHSDQAATTIFGTRGCVYRCAFCDTSLWRRKWRSRSPENIIAEINEVKRDYGIGWFRFPDDCLDLDRKWFIDFCRSIKQCAVQWTMLSRADRLDGEILGLAKEAGCREIFFGFETGSQRLLDRMDKKITVEQNIRAVELCRAAGIISCAYMLFAFPGEDAATIEETKRFLLAAKPDKSRISQFIPVPGSDVWLHPEKYGVRIKFNFDEHWYFDDPDFAVAYDYIGNDTMAVLRKTIMDFYREQGYCIEWEQPK